MGEVQPLMEWKTWLSVGHQPIRLNTSARSDPCTIFSRSSLVHSDTKRIDYRKFDAAAFVAFYFPNKHKAKLALCLFGAWSLWAG